MSVNVDLFKSVADSVKEAAKAVGFEEADRSAGADEKELWVSFTGEKGDIRLAYSNERIALYEGEKKLQTSLLSSDASAADVKYVAGEFAETINEKFGVKAAVKKKSAAKTQQTVSKMQSSTARITTQTRLQADSASFFRSFATSTRQTRCATASSWLRISSKGAALRRL